MTITCQLDEKIQLVVHNQARFTTQPSPLSQTQRIGKIFWTYILSNTGIHTFRNIHFASHQPTKLFQSICKSSLSSNRMTDLKSLIIYAYMSIFDYFFSAIVAYTMSAIKQWIFSSWRTINFCSINHHDFSIKSEVFEILGEKQCKARRQADWCGVTWCE